VQWRMLTIGSSVWAPFTEHGWCLQRSKNDQFRVLKVIHLRGLS
jgi:hypothetical protein